jgi:FixJ family two-component response regulator
LSRYRPSHSRYNNELVKCLEDLREKREQVNKAILKEEKEKATIQKQVGISPVRVVIEIHFLPRTFSNQCIVCHHFPAHLGPALSSKR